MKKIKNYTPFILIGLTSLLIIMFLHYFGAFSFVESKLYNLRFNLRGPLIGWDSNFSKSKFPEKFEDTNKNGLYDLGEKFEDIGNRAWNTNEKYTDTNDNDLYDPDEQYDDKGNGIRDAGQNVVIVQIDDESYRLIPEGYPYTRGRVWSKVIENLTRAKAKAIVFDIMFDAPDHTTQIVKNYLSDSCEDCNYLDADSEFANAIGYAKKNNTDIILGSKLVYNEKRIPPQYYLFPNRTILQSNPTVGLIDVETDIVDDVIRRYPIFQKISSDPNKYYSLAIQAALSYYNIYNTEMDADVANSSIKIGDLEISTFSREASFLLNFYGPPSNTYQTFDTFSLSNIIDDNTYDLSIIEEDDDWMDKYIDENNPLYRFFGDKKNPFKNKIVIIGSSLAEDNDFLETPYFSYNNSENPMPGVEVHANAIQQLIDSNFIKVPTSTLRLSNESFIFQLFIVVSLIITALFISNIFSLVWSVVLIVLTGFSWFSFSMGAFIGDQLWIFKNIVNLFLINDLSFNTPIDNNTYLLPVFFPMASIFLTFGINLSYKLITEQKNKKFLKDTFGKYVSPKLIDEMYKNKELPALGGESGIRTAFFSDLQSFSTISEQLTSTELVELLNEFLSSQTEIIIDKKGTLDKYEGDAILAFFGAPMFFEDHPRAAVDSSVHCKNNLVRLTEKWNSEGDKWPSIVHTMKMRIGVNSGEMVTGNMGSKHHMNYTMMGDVVNTAARLESAAKQYGICIFTTEDTLQSAGSDRYCWRYIDRVQFVGKTVWLQTVEIINFKEQVDEDTVQLVDLFHKGLDKYYNQEWDEAIEIFNESLKLEKYDVSNYTNPSQVFIDRSYEFKKFPPRKGWRGAFVLTSK